VGNAGGVDAEEGLGSDWQVRPADRLARYSGNRSGVRSGAAGRATECAVLAVVEAPAGRLDM